MGTYSLPHIRRIVVQEGLTHHSPSVRLSKSHISHILTNPFYTGAFLWKGVLYQGNHAAIISRHLFDKVQAPSRSTENHSTSWHEESKTRIGVSDGFRTRDLRIHNPAL